uniref:Alpha-D-phosphohexomutase alpha/beta/alpha domain-containing protein n=1 Tax=Meloidogyne floridensis TaxID=298350 RepID=A0A915NXE1_9BILA
MSSNPNDKFAIINVESKPFAGQKPGTSGLRKKVPEFQQQHYTENFIQCVLDGGLGANKRGSILVVGGDGRFLCAQAVNIIIKIAAANGVSKLIIGRDGILSTPAVTERIYELTTKISKYYICPELNIDFGEIGTSTVNIQDFGPFTIQVIDSVKDYADLMEEIFDFPKIRSFISETSGDGRKFNIIVDSMHGVTGPYVSNIFVDRLGAQSNCCLRTVSKPDFGGIFTITIFAIFF